MISMSRSFCSYEWDVVFQHSRFSTIEISLRWAALAAVFQLPIFLSPQHGIVFWMEWAIHSNSSILRNRSKSKREREDGQDEGREATCYTCERL
ncbi:hypothetical protein MPTK1_1g22470 [Marchantia polymorpha subsp. ruderalis]|uniref:Uncharacterized protein n=2 Tax=Marchantia polymorpha TaxID=3197 RepID=A0AAF6AT46_MARPO|nr:hypothetical protein MARPO_0118s0040 [Marchantia polymorpha]BBM99616.1 hypothetical protein Mp_1g22470 [Marchantia polymorpha subsp. ruderalis]|eukprot:PTQ30909.1 hypothetical protein MARPO_0118s0040 [Marchantia polymorpha]